MKAFANFLKATPLAMLALSVGLAVAAFPACAQMPMPTAQTAQPQQTTDSAPPQDTQAQIMALRQQVVKLQAALLKRNAMKAGSSKGDTGAAKPAMEAEGMGEDSGEMSGATAGEGKAPMGAMKNGGGEMGAMPAGGAMQGKKAEPTGGKGCCGMSMGKPMAKPAAAAGDKMSGMSPGGMPAKVDSPMPGSKMMDGPHLLHVGAKDFYLDHAQHIGLSEGQKTKLEKIKSTYANDKAASEKQIGVAQGELWQLTSADQPNTAAIDMKVKEIATTQANEQLMFIHSVSEASNVLTPEQRAQVVMPVSSAKGMKTPMAKQPKTAPMKME